MHRTTLLLVASIALVPAGAWPQGNPMGPEFRVNTYTSNAQSIPHVAMDSAGNFVVIWTSTHDGEGYGIFGQRFDSSGALSGPEFQVNSYTTGDQIWSSVAAASSGDFVVVWQSEGQDGSLGGIYGQRYAASGVPLGPEFRVNTFTTSRQTVPTVASNGAGEFVVAWNSYPQDGSGYGAFAQRFGSSGAPLGSEFRVNTYTTSLQAARSAAVDPLGNFIIMWNSFTQDGSNHGVYGQRYSSAGVPLGPEFRVNEYTVGFQSYPQVAADASGNFTVIWSGITGAGLGIFGQRYDNNGAPLGPQFNVNTYVVGDQYLPSLAMDSAGDFVAVWGSVGQDGSSTGIFGQRYAAGGSPLGLEFRVNTYTTNRQHRPAVAAAAGGSFVVVWASRAQPRDDIYGQRFSMIVPVELIQFRVE